ncbi:flavin reductase family protein [Phytohabitans houttuyneae]|uniref:Flavin-dependent reductase n=1 Tax=Phytohabitans houttuyneae TaxID=1076126 RepID=A0A6V8KIP9_9ACTN|nr:flavin reductase family protein [Phytohabitans houttuyneae]GFJ83714.1 flavin-dependent reductase [Phytohabitans houttuyneae]
MTTTDDHADSPPPTPLAPNTFRTLLRRLAATVVVVTADCHPPVGFTATSLTSVSLRPPLLSFCVDRSSSSWPAVRAARHVGIHLLSQRQEDVARHFATRGIDRFGGVEWHCGPHGVALLADPLVWLVCRVAHRIVAGDHIIVLSEPLEGGHLDEALSPLMYHMGGYLT